MDLEPVEGDVELAVAAQRRLGEASLRRAQPDEPRCRSCRHFLDPSAAIAYCWHPSHRALVDADWRCVHQVDDRNR